MVDEAQDEAELELEPLEEEPEEAEEQEPVEPRERLSLTAQISAVLFVSPKPVSIDDLAEATLKDPAVVEDAISQVQEMFADSLHGFSLVEVAGGYQFRTARGAAPAIRRFKPPKARRLSRAAAETLAVVAYKQPVQRAEIESIRGVDALPTLKTLVESKLIRVVGHENSVGRPALYGTTPRFLEVFGLRDLSELPSIRELEQLADDPGETDDWQQQLNDIVDDQDAPEVELTEEDLLSAEQPADQDTVPQSS